MREESGLIGLKTRLERGDVVGFGDGGCDERFRGVGDGGGVGRVSVLVFAWGCQDCVWTEGEGEGLGRGEGT